MFDNINDYHVFQRRFESGNFDNAKGGPDKGIYSMRLIIVFNLLIHSLSLIRLTSYVPADNKILGFGV